eukprot:GFUD01009361.1.p1 GENE.GFUD01009361.1~~GFUD01009361.1.p1  ORF type:complete len:129 (-),score=29.24 GFUD01009361.1:226-612(-)
MQNIQTVLLALAIFTVTVVFYLKGFLTNFRMAQGGLRAVDYEVFGRVQGVFFRKFTNDKANSLGLRGWVKNTRDQTVKGQMEGDASDISDMKNWLQETGSPMSRIDKVVFNNERPVDQFSFENFKVSH